MKKRKVGLVLAGGGGLGAYQIGVWKALRETDLDTYITSVAGTSVGGLNAALFVQNDFEKAENIWKDISPKQILSYNGGWFSRDGMEDIIDKNLDMRCFDEKNHRNISCWLTCRRVDKEGKNFKGEYDEQCTLPNGEKVVWKHVVNNIEYINLQYIPTESQEKKDEKRKKYLLGTSAMPIIYPQEEIDGSWYADGGTHIYGGDNIPVKPLYEIDKCDIILIVYLSNTPINRDDFPSAQLFEFFPRKDLPALDMLNFTSKNARKLIDRGYDDYIKLCKNIRDNIDKEQTFLKGLAEKWAECKNITAEKLYWEENEKMENNNYNDVAIDSDSEIIENIIKSWSNDDLIELLCECETCLQENDFNFEKLKKTNLLYQIFTGMRWKTKKRIGNNFQRLHKITLDVEKCIISRLGNLALSVAELAKRDTINSLTLKAQHKKFTQYDLSEWVEYQVEKYQKEPYLKKILYIVSDIHMIDPMGYTNFLSEKRQKAIERLGLKDFPVEPSNFVEKLLDNCDSFELYVTDELKEYQNTNEVSPYGELISEAYDLLFNPVICELKEDNRDAIKDICLNHLQNYAKEHEIEEKSADDICVMLLDDLQNAYCFREQKIQSENSKVSQEHQEQEKIESHPQEYKLSVLDFQDQFHLYQYNLDGAYESHEYENKSDISLKDSSKKDLVTAINNYSTSLIVKPSNLKLENLNNCKAVSQADLWFCLWKRYTDKTKEKGKQYMAILDYYDHKLSVSYYSISANTNDCKKIKEISDYIKWDRLPKNKAKDIITGLSGLTKENIIVYKTFQEDKIDKKLKELDDLNLKVDMMEDRLLENLKNPDGLKAIMDMLYDMAE